MIAQYFDIIILFLVVFFIYQRLKNVLGTRPDNTETRRLTEEEASKIFDIIIKDSQKNNNFEKTTDTVSSAAAINLSSDEQAMQKIPGFDKQKFIKGAKRAFEIILEAFNHGDNETLEMLIKPDLLKKFQTVIEQRHQDGITSETDFICFDNVDITKVEIDDDKVAHITVKFESQQVNMLKNAEGNIIEGDDKYIQNITDIWTFTKALTSTNPNWLLVSTKK